MMEVIPVKVSMETLRIRMRRSQRVLAAGLLGMAFGASAVPALAQGTAAPNRNEFQATVTPRSSTQGVPESQISCSGQRSNDVPTLHCSIRFATPIDVNTEVVVDGKRNVQWTAVFHEFDRTQDDTAFYILVDRRSARTAEMRDLSEVFARAKGRQQIAVSSFANDLSKLQPFTADHSALRDAFSRISPGGSASELLHYASVAITELRGLPAPRKVLVIASSGKADDKGYNVDEVIKAAQQAGVRIVALGYVEQSVDSPYLQILERMATATGGYYYKSDLKKPLPQDVRDTILTRFGAGGTLDATAPDKEVPSSPLEVTLRHPGNLNSNFAVTLVTDVPTDQSPWLRSFSNPWILIAAAVAILLIIIAAVLLLRQGKRREEPKPVGLEIRPPTPLASVDEVRENLKAQREVIGLPEPTMEPAMPAPELVERPAPAPRTQQDGPIIAWLEFTASPGRVAVRKKHVTIGRQADNDVVTDANEDTVSRHHAVLSVNNNGRFQITNRSTEYRHTPNPIFINDKELERAELSGGDRITLGTGNYGFVFVEAH
jgi:hypothetical protein